MPNYTEAYDEATEQILLTPIKTAGKCHCCGIPLDYGEEVYTFRGNRYCDTDCIVEELKESREIDMEFLPEEGE